METFVTPAGLPTQRDVFIYCAGFYEWPFNSTSCCASKVRSVRFGN